VHPVRAVGRRAGSPAVRGRGTAGAPEARAAGRARGPPPLLPARALPSPRPLHAPCAAPAPAPAPALTPEPPHQPCACSLGCDISFSTAGGVEIEENWDKVKTVTLATGQGATSERFGGGGGWAWGESEGWKRQADGAAAAGLWSSIARHPRTHCPPAPLPLPGEALAPLVAPLPLELRPKMEAFIRNCFEVGSRGDPLGGGTAAAAAAPGPGRLPPDPQDRCLRFGSQTASPELAPGLGLDPPPQPHPTTHPPTPRSLTTWTARCWR
jgi:hypothetical protein